MKRLSIAVFSIVLAVTHVAGAQTNITFEPRPTGSRAGIEGYTEGGMLFDDALSPGSVIAPEVTEFPSNGTAFLSKCGFCRPNMQAEEGGLFDLFSLDVGEHLVFGSGPFPLPLIVTGTRADGTITAVQLTTDGLSGFETMSFDDSFRDLVRVDFTTSAIFTAVGIDNIVVAVGIDKPELVVSPPSGTYVTTQAFDLTLILLGSDDPQLVAATLDGADFSQELEVCAVAGSLETAPGATLRCALDLTELGEGEHLFEATVEGADGSTTSTDATWEVLEGVEP